MPGAISCAISAPARVPAPRGRRRRRLRSACCLVAAAGTMKLLPSVVLKLLLAAGKLAGDGGVGCVWRRGSQCLRGYRGGRSLQQTPARTTWWGPRSPAGGARPVRDYPGSGPGSHATSLLPRSTLGAGDRRQPRATSARAGAWNRQPGLSHGIYGPAAAPGRRPRPRSPGLGRDRFGPFQRCVKRALILRPWGAVKD